MLKTLKLTGILLTALGTTACLKPEAIIQHEKDYHAGRRLAGLDYQVRRLDFQLNSSECQNHGYGAGPTQLCVFPWVRPFKTFVGAFVSRALPGSAGQAETIITQGPSDENVLVLYVSRAWQGNFADSGWRLVVDVMAIGVLAE